MCRICKLKEDVVRKNFERNIKARNEIRSKGNVESVWKNMKKCLVEVSDEVCGRTKDSQQYKESWWWNENVAKVIEEKRKFYSMWKKSGNEEDRLLNCVARRRAKQAVYKAQSGGYANMEKQCPVSLREAKGYEK
nr:uncharacterized protein LOC124814947 [Hydra vulgaris]